MYIKNTQVYIKQCDKIISLHMIKCWCVVTVTYRSPKPCDVGSSPTTFAKLNHTYTDMYVYIRLCIYLFHKIIYILTYLLYKINININKL